MEAPKIPRAKTARSRIRIPKSSRRYKSFESETVPGVVELEKRVDTPTLILDMSAKITGDLNHNTETVDNWIRFNDTLALVQPETRIRVDEYNIL